MGGAVALKVHLKQPQDWDGVVLVAPMCKVPIHSHVGIQLFAPRSDQITSSI